MKLSIKFATLFLSIFIIILCVFDLNLNAFNINETNVIIQDASYNPMQKLISPIHPITSNEVLIEDVIRHVVLSKQSDCDIEVQILSVDYLAGLLDLNIIQTYRHLNGEVEKIQERRTIIIEEE